MWLDISLCILEPDTEDRDIKTEAERKNNILSVI